MGDFKARLRAPPRSQDEVVHLTADVFGFASRAAQVFQAGSGVQNRMILEAVGSNYTLKGREVAFSLRNPFSRIARARASSDWWTCGDDVRTWIQETTELFQVPAIQVAPQVYDPLGLPGRQPASSGAWRLTGMT
jgi:hypothetical protein